MSTNAKTVKLETSGTHCSSCALLIETTIAEMPGVLEASADHGQGIASASFDPEITTGEAIAEEIRKLGYGAEIVCQ